ncbi:hypothetical protein [[Eubacterium] cellulosolvens]
MPALVYDCLALGWNGEGDWRRFLQFMLSGAGVRRYAYRRYGGKVVLTAQSKTDTSAGFSQVSVQFQADGEFEFVLLNDTPQFQGVPGQWWSEGAIDGVGDDYAVRSLSSGAVGTWFSSPGADDTWLTMTTLRGWGNRRVSGDGTGTTQVNRTFEVGPEPSGPADDSAFIQTAAVIT